MGAGDTIPGQVRVVAERTNGSQPVIIGNLSQDDVDYLNNTINANEKLYVNTALSDKRNKPAGARSLTEPRAVWSPGETLKVQHQESGSLAEAIDYDEPNAFNIDVVITDLNRGTTFTRTLGVSDTELSSNPTSSNSEWVTIYEFTVPDRQKLNIAGQFEAVATENA